MHADLAELEAELGWFTRLLDQRFRQYFSQPDGESGGAPVSAHAPPVEPPPDLSASATAYAAFVSHHAQELDARAALVLALVPALRPQMLDVFFTRNATFDRRFTEFGGMRRDDEFEPTGDTLAFVLGGGSIAARVAVNRLLAADAPLIQTDALRLDPALGDRPALKSRLRLSPDHLALFTTGQRPDPTQGPDFPAQRIETALDWDDLILHRATLEQLQEIKKFIDYSHTLMHDWGMAARLRPGLRALFYGPPGTGKTMSAALLGKHTGREVYRIDLSLVVSKYIGETTKNLAQVFAKAQQRNWILFFDEADALFGKRGETNNSHDRHSNQEVAYLLQRIETFDGIVILASNLRANMDPAFNRRFELVVYFPMPRAEDRGRLWRRGFPDAAKLASDVDFDAIARGNELSGGSIMNVIRQVSLNAIARGCASVAHEDISQGIARELQKGGG